MTPEGWGRRRIGELVTNIGDGGTPRRDNPSYFGGDVPWVVIQDIKPLITVTKNSLTKEGLDACSAKLWPKNAVILSTGATIGEVGIAGVPLTTKQGITGMVCEEYVVPKFLYYLLQQKKQYLQTLAQGSTIREVRPPILKQMDVNLPPKFEQKKIAAILSSVDDAIQATQAVIDQTHRVKQGLLQQLLTRGIGHTRFKQTEIGEIPEEWKVYTIGESCSVENNRRKPINAKTREQMKGTYPYYGPTGIIDYINEYRLEGKYVLIGEDGDHFLKYNDWSMTQLVVGKFNVNNHAHVIRGINDCSTEWVFHYFRHRDIISHLTRQGAGRYKLKKATLIELPIAVPPLNEQKKICAFLDSIDQTQESRVNELNHFKVIKRGLMQDLLTGRVRVKPDEVNTT